MSNEDDPMQYFDENGRPKQPNYWDKGKKSSIVDKILAYLFQVGRKDVSAKEPDTAGQPQATPSPTPVPTPYPTPGETGMRGRSPEDELYARLQGTYRG